MSTLDDEALFLAWLGLCKLTESRGGYCDLGNSAMNLVRQSLGGADDGARPWDSDDDGRCERMMARAPAALAQRMRAIHATWVLVRLDPIGQLTAAERAQLRTLTLAENSAMAAWLDFVECLLADATVRPEESSFMASNCIVRARLDGVVVGWAVVLYANCPAVFVNLRHRRRRIGRALAVRLRMHHPHTHWVTRVMDPGARAFWTALDVTVVEP